MDSEDSSKKPQRNGGPGKLRGANDGVPFTKDYQPSNESKKAGQQRKKFNRKILQDMLNLKYRFHSKTKLKNQLIAIYGEDVLEMNVGEIMGLQQMEKAITLADSNAFNTVMNQAYGQPKQETEITEKKIVIRKV